MLYLKQLTPAVPGQLFKFKDGRRVRAVWYDSSNVASAYRGKWVLGLVQNAPIVTLLILETNVASPYFPPGSIRSLSVRLCDITHADSEFECDIEADPHAELR